MTATHLAEQLMLPAGYDARPYVGPVDHPAMIEVLRAHRALAGEDEIPTLASFDLTYANLEGCDPATDIAIVEFAGDVVGYVRTLREDLETTRDLYLFTPAIAEHVSEPLIGAMIDGAEAHTRAWAQGPTRYRTAANRQSPDTPATGLAAWIEARGYTATEWSAQLVRPHLDDIPTRELPAGVELRPVTPELIREVLAAEFEAFRGEWDFREPVESDYTWRLEHPLRDESMWKVAWAGDTVVGQVKPFISHEENAERGYLRGYTENIATHRDWRNQGIAGALLAMSLVELRDRGMTEAALGVDTNNPGGAFQLYTSLGFEVRSYEATYTKPL